jgi:hypothetical protein
VKQGIRVKLACCWLRRALAYAIRHHFIICKPLHNIDDEKHSFCSLTAVETDHGKLAMGRWLGSLTTAVVVTSDGASVLGMALAAVVMAEGAPPSGSSAQKALVRRVDGAAVQGQWWLGFLARQGHEGLLFIEGKVVEACSTWTHATLISNP